MPGPRMEEQINTGNVKKGQFPVVSVSDSF